MGDLVYRDPDSGKTYKAWESQLLMFKALKDIDKDEEVDFEVNV